MEIAGAGETISTIAKIIMTLKQLFEKMKPGLAKIDGVVTAMQHTMALLKTLKRVGRADETMGNPIIPIDMGDDAINMTADWDVFDAQMDGVFDPVR